MLFNTARQQFGQTLEIEDIDRSKKERENHLFILTCICSEQSVSSRPAECQHTRTHTESIRRAAFQVLALLTLGFGFNDRAARGVYNLEK